MDKNSRTILSEVLLEISLAIGSELEFDKIVSKTISLWLRRLNCTRGAFLKYLDGQVIIRYIIPTYLKEKPLNPELIRIVTDGQIDLCVEFNENEVFSYVFPLGQNRYFYFMRNEKLTKEQCNELFPITQFFGKAVANSRERERRIKAEKELRNEKHLLRTVIDHIPEALYLKDLERRKIIANKADLKLTGKKNMSDILGKLDEEVYDEGVARLFVNADKTVLEEGKAVIDQEILRYDDQNEKLWLLNSKYPYRNEEGKLIGIVGISRDVTELKESQEYIKRLSLVASQTTNGVIITDINGKTVWVNEGLTRLSGYTFEEMVGSFPGDLLQGPDSDPKIIQKMSLAVKKQEPFEVEIINYTKDGVPYWIHVNCNPLQDENGIVNGFMAIESDITEKVIFQQELINSKNIAEDAQQAEKTFLANMSHEIRTPLNAIIGMSSLLIDTDPTFEQKEYIETLDHSSKFLMRLINDILDMAKIESGKVEVRTSHFDLHECIKNLYRGFKVSGLKNQVKVYLSMGEKVPKDVIGDEVLILQALNNIVGNAVKFTKGGEVKIKVKHKSTNHNIAFVQFVIEDTGIGMSNDELDVIFKKFKQVGNQNNSQKGTGLGLAITKQIIDILGGEIYVTSKKEVGTKFQVSIPLEITDAIEIETEANQHKKSAIPEANAVRKALIVEDNLINQKYISKLLEKNNLEFSIANNGQEAIDLCFRETFGIILMDIQMPKLNGFEATQMIRNSNNPNASVPIIALTASAMSDQRTKAIRLGMDDYLSKPFTPDQLEEKLNKFKIIDII